MIDLILNSGLTVTILFTLIVIVYVISLASCCICYIYNIT